eukprot:scaffold185883_cov31-Tisochrysis_lutea.AAC.2
MKRARLAHGTNRGLRPTPRTCRPSPQSPPPALYCRAPHPDTPLLSHAELVWHRGASCGIGRPNRYHPLMRESHPPAYLPWLRRFVIPPRGNTQYAKFLFPSPIASCGAFFFLASLSDLLPTPPSFPARLLPSVSSAATASRPHPLSPQTKSASISL